MVRNIRRMVAADHDRNIAFSSALRLKDVEYAVRFAREVGIGSPFGVTAERIYRQLCEMGHADLNESKIIDACRTQARSATLRSDRPDLPRTSANIILSDCKIREFLVAREALR